MTKILPHQTGPNQGPYSFSRDRIAPSWFTPYFQKDWCQDDRRELRSIVRGYLSDRQQQGYKARTLTDRLMGYFTNSRDEARELIHAALDLGFIRRHQLDPRDLPKLAVVVLTSNERVHIELHGRVRPTRNPLRPDVSGLRLVIASKLDGVTIVLPVDATGKVLPYLRLVYGPIAQQLPKLWAYLKLRGLVKSLKSPKSNRVYLSRLVKAATGCQVSKLEVHHNERACGILYAGADSLDCRAEVLELLTPEQHRRLHQLLGRRHFHNEVAVTSTLLIGIGTTPVARPSGLPNTSVTQPTGRAPGRGFRRAV